MFLRFSLVFRKDQGKEEAGFVERKCPVCPADSLSNLRGFTQKSHRDVADVPGPGGLSPIIVPGTLRRHTDHQIRPNVSFT